MSRISSRRQALAVDLGAVEAREDVVARLFEALVEDVVEVRVELLADVTLDLEAFLRIHVDRAGSQDPVTQPLERAELLPRQAHQSEEHRRRERFRELVGEVALAPIDEHVDEVVHAFGDVALDGVHLLRREDRIEDLAVLEVARRVDAQRDERPHVAELEEPFGGEDLAVLEGRLHRLAARDHVDAGHRLHDLGLHQELVARLGIDGVGERLVGEDEQRSVDRFLVGRLDAGHGVHGLRFRREVEPGASSRRGYSGVAGTPSGAGHV